jgi:hypothetical protein
MEGDPVTTLYRALPGRAGVEVLVDATHDHFGGGRWSRAVCAVGPRTKDLTCQGAGPDSANRTLQAPSDLAGVTAD